MTETKSLSDMKSSNEKAKLKYYMQGIKNSIFKLRRLVVPGENKKQSVFLE